LKATILEILDFCFELRFSADFLLPLNKILRPFIVSECENKCRPTILEIVDESFDGADSSEHLAKRYRSLVMERRGTEQLFRYFTGQFLSNQDFTRVKLWLPFDRQMSIEHDGQANFSGDPSLRLITWARASLEGYCYMHGALIVLDGNYVLLIGSSGTGKTTLSGLACDCGATRLTEEDPFISCKENVPFAHGTPWPGLRGPAAPVSGVLSAIFYLRHASKNEIRPLSVNEACQQLLQHSRTFNWLPETIPAAIELFDNVAQKVPSYDFGFVPDISAVNTIRSTL